MNSKNTKSKKTKLTSSTPANNGITDGNGDFADSLSASFEISSSPQMKSAPKAKTLPMLDLICKAIEVTGTPGKGASYISIKKWIISNSEIPISDAKFTASMRRAFKKGLEIKRLGRPKRSKDSVGLVGWFVLLKLSPKEPKLASVKEGPKSNDKTKKAKGKSTNGTQAADPVVDGKSNGSDTVVVKIDMKKPKTAVKKKVRETKVEAESTREGMTSKIARKRSPKIVVKKTTKTRMPEVHGETTAEVTKSQDELKGASKKKASKTTLVSKSKETERANSKVPKPEVKPVNSKAESKETKTKKLYSSNVKMASRNIPRKDLSDTELEVKPLGRKSLKSYASDTDINAIGLDKVDLDQAKKKRKHRKN